MAEREALEMGFQGVKLASCSFFRSSFAQPSMETPQRIGAIGSTPHFSSRVGLIDSLILRLLPFALLFACRSTSLLLEKYSLHR
jgi:hypothetical protein